MIYSSWTVRAFQRCSQGTNQNHSFSPLMTQIDLRRLNCTLPGRGPWKVFPDISNRAILVKNTRSNFSHKVYFGTRTERTQEDAEIQATALCAVLNALKAKRV